MAVYCFNGSPTGDGTSPFTVIYRQIQRFLVCFSIGCVGGQLTHEERFAVMSIARLSAEAAVNHELYLEMHRQLNPSESGALEPSDLFFVWREDCEFRDNKPGYAGTFIFRNRIGSVCYVLVGARAKPFAATHLRAAEPRDRIWSLCAILRRDSRLQSMCNRLSHPRWGP